MYQQRAKNMEDELDAMDYYDARYRLIYGIRPQEMLSQQKEEMLEVLVSRQARRTRGYADAGVVGKLQARRIEAKISKPRR